MSELVAPHNELKLLYRRLPRAVQNQVDEASAEGLVSVV
jgi:hypothetical protein